MAYAPDARISLIALEESLTAIERAVATGEWNEVAVHEPSLTANWRFLAGNIDRSLFSPTEKLRLETLLKRVRSLTAQLAARKAQITPLIDAFVPAESTTTLPSP